jgi:RNA recognition motif-containing protein
MSKYIKTPSKFTPKGETLIIRNMSTRLRKEEIISLFSKCGRVKGVRVSKTEVGVAQVFMLKQRDAIRAINLFHNREIDGRKLQVSTK